MRAAAQTRPRLVHALPAGVAVVAALFAAAPAGAEQTAETRHETQRLRSANETLATETQAVRLELYALESQLRRAQARLAALEREAAAVERRRETTAERLRLVRRTLAEAEQARDRRLRELYTVDDPDPLAVLLGAETLDEAVTTLDNLDRFAAQDAAIVRQVDAARADVRSTLRELAARGRELERLEGEAEATAADLASAQDERRSYLARLTAEQRLNRARLARLAAQARAAQAEAAKLEAQAPEPAAAERAEPSPAPSPPPAPAPAPAESTPPPAPAAGPGTQMTVVATGYSLSGTTATGMPVGPGVVAVDPAVIPLGTRMTIPGYGEGVAADTGSAVRGRVIDLWFPTRAQALAWGRRTVTITLR